MNHWSDCSCLRWLVALVALVPVMACTPDPPQPDPTITTGIPTPPQPSSTSHSPTVTAKPSASATPSSEELVRQTQAAYQIAFDEFERLSWAGGADEPSPKMKEVMEGVYLTLATDLLREQNADGYRIEGRAATTRSRSAPGTSMDGSDPRLTLQVCEDRRGATLVERSGKRVPSGIVAGHVFASSKAGRIKLVSISTQAAEACGW